MGKIFAKQAGGPALSPQACREPGAAALIYTSTVHMAKWETETEGSPEAHRLGNLCSV